MDTLIKPLQDSSSRKSSITTKQPFDMHFRRERERKCLDIIWCFSIFITIFIDLVISRGDGSSHINFNENKHQSSLTIISMLTKNGRPRWKHKVIVERENKSLNDVSFFQTFFCVSVNPSISICINNISTFRWSMEIFIIDTNAEWVQKEKDWIDLHRMSLKHLPKNGISQNQQKCSYF